MRIENLISQCREKNKIIEDVFAAEEKTTLEDFIERQRGKLLKNRQKVSQKPAADFYQICERRINRRLSPKEAHKVMECLEARAMLTADHLGGLYSPQSFQGDLLFSRLLENDLQKKVDILPCFALGSVSLGAETYARGILSFSSCKEPDRMPLFGKKYINSAASYVPGLDRSQILKARGKTGTFIQNPETAGAVVRLLDEVYLAGSALSGERFSDQVMDLGLALSKSCLSGFGGPSFLYFETEELCTELIIHDLQDPESLLSLLLHDERVIESLNKTFADNDQPLGSLLFRAADRSLRSYPLHLISPGVLKGTSIGNQEETINFDDESLVTFLRERKLLPGAYLCALLTAMVRGITWYGGIFQSLYLPRWQALTLKALKEAGYADLAREVCQWELSGYISGPVFALYDTGDGAVNAGPVEFYMKKPDASR